MYRRLNHAEIMSECREVEILLVHMKHKSVFTRKKGSYYFSLLAPLCHSTHIPLAPRPCFGRLFGSRWTGS